MRRIGSLKALFAPPARACSPLESLAPPAGGHAWPTALAVPPRGTAAPPERPGARRRAALRGLDKCLRMGEGRATRGEVWGRPRERRVGECWEGMPHASIGCQPHAVLTG